MDADPRYEIENAEIKALLKEMGRRLGNSMPPGWGFTLFIIEHDGSLDGGAAGDDQGVLREFIQREEAN